MTTEKKDLLLRYIESEIQKAKENALKADEASKLIISRPSQSGDQYHAQKAADLAQLYVSNLERLKKEISDARNETVDVIKPVCYVEIRYDDGSNLDFYLVKNAVSLTKFLLISVNSPFGSVVLGKKSGESFSYELRGGEGTKVFSGKIIKVE